ncbi:unnamed protein product [Polarella glacialis]|uniref:Phosphodiesterase n=3 Tax=Polarella glacialis TaxID=89957 RepID=A0A813IMM8_POLGL|nr:unnamed protein product [Polarella glacialis]
MGNGVNRISLSLERPGHPSYSGHADSPVHACSKNSTSSPVAAEMSSASSSMRDFARAANPFRNWGTWFKASEELVGFRPTVDFLHTISSDNTCLEKYVKTIIGEVMRVLDADRCSIFFVNEVRKEVLCVGSIDLAPFSMPWDKGVVGAVVHQGDMLNLADAHLHRSFDNTVEKQSGYVSKALLCLPIKHVLNMERTIGVIQALNKRSPNGKLDGEFSEQDAVELAKLALVIGDSFYRQRWMALERAVSSSDTQVRSVVAYHGAQSAQQSCSRSSCQGSRLNGGANNFGSLQVDSSWESEDIANAEVASLDFDVLAYSEVRLEQLVPLMLQQAGCSEHCRLADDCVQRWVEAVRLGYYSNPFHNWAHGFSALQMCFYQLRSEEAFSSFSHLDTLGLFIAALSHDIGHPGLTNSFLVNSCDELAMRYNDVSVLENHHASLACQLLQKKETAICSELDQASQKSIRRIMIACILATDMNIHTDLCRKIAACMGSEELNVGHDKQFLMNVCIHTSDLSAQVKSWQVASEWEGRISKEFSEQARQEFDLGLPTAPFMQFDFNDVKQRGKLQRDFIDFVLVPLWDPYTQLLPTLKPCFQNLIENREHFEAIRSAGE